MGVFWSKSPPAGAAAASKEEDHRGGARDREPSVSQREPVDRAEHLGEATTVRGAGSEHYQQWQAEQQAVWVPDASCQECMLCSASFGWFCRKHHCRQCGSLVCAECSPHRALARGYLTPQRICAGCMGAMMMAEQSAINSRKNSLKDQYNDSNQQQDAASVTASSAPASRNASRRSSPSRLAAERRPSVSTAGASSSSNTSSTLTDSPSAAAANNNKRTSISGAPAFQPLAQAAHNTTPNPLPAAAAAVTTEDAAATTDSSSSSSSSSIPAPSSAPAPFLAESLAPLVLFNRLAGFGSLLVLDVRSADSYKASHVPRALNIPLSDGDLLAGSSPSSSASSSSAAASPSSAECTAMLAALEQRLHMTDQRAFRMRQRCTVVLVGEAAAPQLPQDENDHAAAAAAATASTPYSLTPSLSSAHSAHCLHLARLLQGEGRVAGVSVLSGGFAAFSAAYSFTCCGYTAAELRSGKHVHRKSFPWYPNEIVARAVLLGSKVDAANLDHLHHMRVTAILNCTTEIPNLFEDQRTERQGTDQPVFVYKRIQLNDEVNVAISDSFNEAFEFIGQHATHTRTHRSEQKP